MKSALLIIAAIAAGCATPAATKLPGDEADKLRDELAREPGKPDSNVTRDEIAKLELERARKSNSVLAYQKFLADFPLSDEANAAKTLLEDVRFQQAQKTNTREAWTALLEEHPHGKHVVEARVALGSLEIDAALASQDLGLVHSTLGRFPDHPRRDALVAHEDDLAFAAATTAGEDALDNYLSSHPDGKHRIDALKLRGANELQAIADADDLARAKALAAKADATDANRALVADIELRRGLRTLDLVALKELAEFIPAGANVSEAYSDAIVFTRSLHEKPLSAAAQENITKARPGFGLPAHNAVVDAINSGDPIDRVAALRELAEWSDPEDVKVAMAALQSEYVAVRLEAIETLKTLAKSMNAKTWKEIERAKEAEVLSHELSAATWRQLGALREADGRPSDAAAAWRAAVEADGTDLAAHARVFALAQQSGERIAWSASARELAQAATEFADGRWAPSKQKERPPTKGRLMGMPAGLTVLRQICSAMDLGTAAAKALGTIAATAPPEEQQLLLLAKTDAERTLDRIHGKQQELEQSIRSDRPEFPPCGSDESAAVIEKSRKERAAALTALGQTKDKRLLDFVQWQMHTPSPEVRATAEKAASALADGR